MERVVAVIIMLVAVYTPKKIEKMKNVIENQHKEVKAAEKWAFGVGPS